MVKQKVVNSNVLVIPPTLIWGELTDAHGHVTDGVHNVAEEEGGGGRGGSGDRGGATENTTQILQYTISFSIPTVSLITILHRGPDMSCQLA